MVAGLETHLTLMKFIIALLDVEVKPVLVPSLFGTTVARLARLCSTLN
jgi:hypothetical protein